MVEDIEDKLKNIKRVTLAVAAVAIYAVGSFVWDLIKDTTSPSNGYFVFPNQSLMRTSCPTKIHIYRSNTRVWIGGDEKINSQQGISLVEGEEPRDKYERGYIVERLSDSRILVEIPKYPLTLESTPPSSVDPSSSGRKGTYYDYDGAESNHLEDKLRELIPLGLDKADDGLEITVWDNDGIKSVTVEEVGTDLNPIRVIPPIYDYQDSDGYRANFRQLDDFEELVAQRRYKSGGSIGFSLAGRPIPEKRDLRFGYDKLGIGDASLLKVSVVDNFDNSDAIYLELRRK